MHYYKRNIGNYAKRTSRLTLLQHGVYTLLLDACYDREAFPTEEQAVQWLWASGAEEVEAIKFVLNRYFIKSADGTFTHDDVLADLLEYHAMADRNKQIAIDRETKRKQLSTSRAHSVNALSRDMHDSPPNQEPLTKNHKPRTINHKPIKEEKPRASATPSLKPQDVDEQVWADWVKLRKEKKAAITKTALDGIEREAEKAGIGMEDALKACCEFGWQGFNAGWYAQRKPAGQAPSLNKQEALEARNRKVADEWARGSHAPT